MPQPPNASYGPLPDDDANLQKAITNPARKESGFDRKLPRLLKIIETLQSGRLYNAQSLAELCGVSRRTIYRDIIALQKAGLQVLLDETRQGYYLPHRLMFPPSELSIPEALSLLIICQELGGTENGIPFQQAARSAAQKVCQNLPPHVRELLGEISESVSIQVDAHHPLTDAQPHYDVLLRSMIERRSLRIDYDAASAEGRISTLLDPYRILFRRRSWYVIGRSSLHREVRVFHLGRILKVELLDTTYQIPPRFTLERFLGKAWHLIRESQTTEVVIHFAKQVARNVAEVRWHATQQTTFLPNGQLEFRATVDGLEEISWWILGYGDRAEVIQPVELRQRLKAHAEHMLQMYSMSEVAP